MENSEKEALQQQYLEEISHRYDPKYTRRIKFVFDNLLRGIIRHVSLRGLENFRTIPRGVPVILSCTHKSHLDYLLLNSAILEYTDYLPCTIAGKNLYNGYFARMLPRIKAICLDRERVNDENIRSKESIIYLKTFYDYLTNDIFRKSETVMIFPEAGRSYGGFVAPLAHGIFGMAKRALNEDGKVVILPIGATYERVTEDEVFPKLTELKKHGGMGSQYRGCDLDSFKLHFLLQARGRVLFSIGEPMEITAEELKHQDDLGEELRTRMEKLTCLTPVSLVCQAFKNRDSMTFPELYDSIERSMKKAYARGYSMIPGIDPRSTAGYIWKMAKPHLAMPWRRRNILTVKGHDIAVANRDVVNYYINTVRHIFAD